MRLKIYTASIHAHEQTAELLGTDDCAEFDRQFCLAFGSVKHSEMCNLPRLILTS
jgi:hypothetical protein